MNAEAQSTYRQMVRDSRDGTQPVDLTAYNSADVAAIRAAGLIMSELPAREGDARRFAFIAG